MSAGTVVAILAVFWIVLIVGSIAAALAAATRRNRPVPSRRTTAPVWWLAAPTPSAHLHRRVVRSSRGVQRARAMRRRKGAPTVLDEMAARFEDHAVELDDRIALATTLPRRDRRSELMAVHGRVRRSEDVAAELCRAYAAEPAVPGDGHDPLEQVADDLTALIGARRVVDDISRTAHPGTTPTTNPTGETGARPAAEQPTQPAVEALAQPARLRRRRTQQPQPGV